MNTMKRKKLKAARSRPSKSSQRENGHASGDGAPSYTVADLLDRAEALLEEEAEVDAAQRFCLRALEMDPESVHALALTGLLLLESGEERSEEAHFCLSRAAELGGEDVGHSVFLYLGQLAEGQEAVEHYRAGIALLRKQLEAEAEQGAAGGASRWRHEPASWRLVSSAHCAVAEIFMTDLCDEPDAEVQCRANIDAARAADAANPEALNVWAAFLLVKQQTAEARQAMQQSLALWQPALRAALQQGEDEDEEEKEETKEEAKEEEEGPQDVTAATGLNFDARFKSAQTLVEVGMLEDAAEVLESCHAENDEDMRVLYLSAVAHFRLWREPGEQEEEEEEEEAAVKAENARTFLTAALEAAQEGGETEVEEHVREMLAALGDAGKTEEGQEEVPESSGDEEMEEG